MNLKEVYPSKTKALVMTHGFLDSKNAKTAHGVILYSEIFHVVGVIDKKFHGKRVGDVVSFIKNKKGQIPVYSSIEEGIKENLETKVLILGVAPPGGKLPEDWLDEIKFAINHGLDIISGLHVFLSDIPEIKNIAEKRGVRLFDLRKPPKDLTIGLQRVRKTEAKVVLCMGTDCAIGKRSVTTLLWKNARELGKDAGFVATGQTGIMEGADIGAVIDRIPSDFVSGQVEKMVLELYEKGKSPIFVEGQGALFHPSYSGVTLSLLHGADPQVVVLVHDPKRKIREGIPGEIPIPDFREEKEVIEKLSRAKVIFLATWGKDNKEILQKETELPVYDFTDKEEIRKGLFEIFEFFKI